MKKSSRNILICLSVFFIMIIAFNTVYLAKAINKETMADFFGCYPVIIKENPDDLYIFAKKGNLIDGSLSLIKKNGEFLIGSSDDADELIGVYRTSIKNLGRVITFIMDNSLLIFAGLFAVYLAADNYKALKSLATNDKHIQN